MGGHLLTLQTVRPVRHASEETQPFPHVAAVGDQLVQVILVLGVVPADQPVSHEGVDVDDDPDASLFVVPDPQQHDVSPAEAVL